MANKPIPRWQQGFRPFAFEDIWLKMTPEQRRADFLFDMAVVAVIVIAMIIATTLGLMTSNEFWKLIGFMAIFLGILFASNRGPIEK